MHPQAPRLRALAERWAGASAAELANLQTYVTELCDALGVERPRPAGADYAFNYPVSHTDRASGKTTTNFIDLYKRDHFILEGKHVEGDRAAERVLGAAYGQAKGYAGDIPHAPPPFLLVMNVGRTLLVWDRWGGNYGGVNLARRIDLARLADNETDIEYLRAVWENPASLDPGVRGRVVTREVAERLASYRPRWKGGGWSRSAWRASSSAACSPCSRRTWGCWPTSRSRRRCRTTRATRPSSRR